jgi:hypothetical protein
MYLDSMQELQQQKMRTSEREPLLEEAEEVEAREAEEEVEMTRLQGMMEQDESQAMVYIELLRLEQQKLDNLAKLQIQREKNHMDIHNDREKHKESLDSQEKISKNSTTDKKE